MGKYAIINGNIFRESHKFVRGSILIDNGLIKSILEDSSDTNLEGYVIVDAKGRNVFPGFIDVHVNGGGNHLVIEGTDEALLSMALAHAKCGTTSILPTTISCDISDLKNTLRLISKYTGKSIEGANILGSHLEGPFLNPKKGGAHKREFLYSPSIEMLESLYEASKGTLRILSLAPEMEGAFEVIKQADAFGVIVGLAHSEADYVTTKEAIKNGMKLCTHLYNGMSPLIHREPGAIGAFLTSSNVYVEMISDGLHVHPAALEIAIKANAGKTLLVTDAVSPAGTDTKEFDILGTHLMVKGYSCFTPEGGLAGSALTLNRAVDVLNKKTQIGLETIIPMVTEYPAELLGINNQKGSISIGKDADIVIADDDMNIHKVFVKGRLL